MKMFGELLPRDVPIREEVVNRSRRTDIVGCLSAGFAVVRTACGPFEWITFAYLAWLDFLVLFFHQSVPNPTQHLAIQCAVGVGVAALVYLARMSRNGAIHFARHWYPLPLYVFFFEELRSFVHAIFSNWFDAYLIAFDHGLFGVHPSVWFAQFSTPALNDFMQFSYMTYFLYLVALPALLYVNREYAAFWIVMASTALAHYSVYVVAALFPIESPFYSLASMNRTALTGGSCTALIDLIEHFGRVHGAAFPSAHVAGSMVAILASWRYRRWLFWLCLPFFVSMCVATVYGRYHYAADVFAGLILGAIAFRMGLRLKWTETFVRSEYLFLAPQISEGSEVRDEEDESVLTLIADRAE
ncbi:MAG TPA: phosphatase PAP2 family protein [Candidatus Acidoferrales bacterium]